MSQTTTPYPTWSISILESGWCSIGRNVRRTTFTGTFKAAQAYADTWAATQGTSGILTVREVL